MLRIRFRDRTNTWPGFVDLFSNLVIILIFLLIVFVFLWTTTSVFNHRTGLKTVTELRQANAEQAQTIERMNADEQETKRMLIQARNDLESLENSNAALVSELEGIDRGIEDLVGAYETKLAQLRAQDDAMQDMVANLTAQLGQARLEREAMTQLEQERRDIQTQMDDQRAALTEQLRQLQDALAAAEEKSSAQEIEYVEMSNRLNRALADKVAELNEMAQYQSAFYRAVKNAMGTTESIRAEGDRFVVPSDILFNSGSYKISDAGRTQLRTIADVIKNLENEIPSDVNWIVRVDGHTDKQPVVPGTRGYSNNTELSLRRATAVVDELVKYGVARRRLVPSGFGEMYPVKLGSDADTLRQNRRIELQLTNR